VLVDTNILIRLIQPHHPLSRVAGDAITLLRSQNRRLCLVPQNLIEFWTVATRPIEVNGLGLSTVAARFEIERLEQFFVLLQETPAIYATWKRLVFAYQVSGKLTYDARLVAAMQVHGLTSVLTFNTLDFRRYDGVEAVDPRVVADRAQHK